MSFPWRLALPAALAGTLAVAALFAPPSEVSAQGVTATATPTTTTSTAKVTFRCPGMTPVSASAEPGAVPTPTSQVIPLDPVPNDASPCAYTNGGPELEWSADYNALRMVTVGSWKDKMRAVLKDFDELHAQYVANPKIKDMGMWPAKLQETFELAYLIGYFSGRDDVLWYAQEFQLEYKSGVYEEHPLLVQYALDARRHLGDLSAPPAPRQPLTRR